MLRFVLVPAALLLGLFVLPEARAQSAGDYRSAASGSWSDPASWSVYDGAAWVPAAAAPTGAEAIGIEGHTVSVDGAVTVTGSVVVGAAGQLTVAGGTLVFGADGLYDHARDGGSLPFATWGAGSTMRLSGTINEAPGNRNQSFHHVIFDTPGLLSNRDMGWGGVTIGGTVHVVSTGTARWQLSSAPGGEARTITILGDVLVEAGQFAVQGTGNAQTTFDVHHHGNLVVTGGNFSLSRGSQGNGSGTTTWHMHAGNVSLSNATTQNSNPVAGQARFAFVGTTPQQLAFTDVTYAGGGFHFEVAETASLTIADGFVANGLVVNRGAITAAGSLTFSATGVYEHARNGGGMPVATWASGSTARLTGITTQAPANRGQDYHHLVLDTPAQTSNLDLALQGRTVGGDLRVVSSGAGRWQLVGGSSGTITLLGDVYVESGQLAVQGTGSATDVLVEHHGDVVVTGGNFSVSRGTQGGTGTTRWVMLGGSVSLSGATTQNSNTAGARLEFAGGGEQSLSLSGVTYAGGGLPVRVRSGATLVVPGDALGGNGAFEVDDEGTLALTQASGLDAAITTTGPVTFAPMAGLRFAGTVPQGFGTVLPDTLGVVAIANPAGVTLSGTTHARELLVEAGARLVVAEAGTLTSGDGTVLGTVVNEGAFSGTALVFADGSVYEHARNGGGMPVATWASGSTARLTGITTQAPANRGQDYHHLVLDTPAQTSNLDLALQGRTVGGDLRVVSSGAGRWQLVGGSSGTITLLGDVYVESGQLAVQGTGSATDVLVEHHGDVVVTGGNFSVSRGTQGGTGTTRWVMLGGSVSLSGATTQNSNTAGARLEFAGGGEQSLSLSGVTYAGGGLPVRVRSGATLVVPGDALGGNGAFEVDDEGMLVTTHPAGLNGAVATTGPIAFAPMAGLRFAGTELQVFGSLMPDSVGVVAIANPAGVVVSDTTFAHQLIVEGGARLHLDETGALSVGSGSVAGAVVNEGALSAEEALAFADGSVYEHARNAGGLPAAAWGEGSTVLLTGITTQAPANRNQSFHHLVFDTPELMSNLNMGFDGVTIGGDIRVADTGTGRWYLTAAPAQGATHVTILGDVLVESGAFAVHGTGNALTTFTVDHYGDIVVTGGNFSIARGSQGSGENSGTTTWTLHEGHFAMANAHSQNSNQGNAAFVFAGAEPQHLALGEGNQLDHLPIRVAAGTTLDLGGSVVSGNDLFVLEEGAFLATANPGGIAGALQNSGATELDEAGGFVFNGAAPQVTSAALPEAVTELVIDNEAGVALTQETTILGVLRLKAGVLDNTVPFVLAEGATIAYEGGSLLFPVSIESTEAAVTEFRLHPNFPNPVAERTTIVFDLREATPVQLSVYDAAGRRVGVLVDGPLGAGRHALEWDASALASGVYFYRISAGDFRDVRRMTIVK